MKPPLPFPLAVNIGTDIVHLPRITRLLSRPGNYLHRFTRRILTESEQREFRARFSLAEDFLPIQASTQFSASTLAKHMNKVQEKSALRSSVTPEMARWLAGRFAAKEAGRKASVTGAVGMGWKNVVVRAGVESELGSGRPDVVLFDGDNGEVGGLGQGRVGRLSISHDGEYVVATVLAAG